MSFFYFLFNLVLLRSFGIYIRGIYEKIYNIYIYVYINYCLVREGEVELIYMKKKRIF